MLYREIIVVCSQIHTKHINTLRGQNAEFENVKPGGIHSDHWALKKKNSYYIISCNNKNNNELPKLQWMLQYSFFTQSDTTPFNITRHLPHDTVLLSACIRQDSCLAQRHDKTDSLYTVEPKSYFVNTDVYDWIRSSLTWERVAAVTGNLPWCITQNLLKTRYRLCCDVTSRLRVRFI